MRQVGSSNGNNGGIGNGLPLDRHEARAAGELIHRVRRYVPADLVHVLLFGSRARGTARPDSDVDLLLIFRSLPADREPQASIAEELADDVAQRAGVPVSPWSVSLVDLERGMRTPMLVDALTDGVPLWPPGSSTPRLRFTEEDALRCTAALLQRVEEGSEEVAERLAVGDLRGAVGRGRDDVVRLCTAALLLRGETRPRRAAAAQRFVEAAASAYRLAPWLLRVLDWAATSFGPSGHDEDRPVLPAPGGMPALAAAVDQLRRLVLEERSRLLERPAPGNLFGYSAYDEGMATFGSPGIQRDRGRLA